MSPGQLILYAVLSFILCPWPLWFLQSFLSLLSRTSKHHLTSGWDTLHLLPSVAGWSRREWLSTQPVVIIISLDYHPRRTRVRIHVSVFKGSQAGTVVRANKQTLPWNHVNQSSDPQNPYKWWVGLAVCLWLKPGRWRQMIPRVSLLARLARSVSS